MDPTKQGGAASSKPYSDLDARLLAMRLGDPSSSLVQARNPAPTPLLLPNPQMELAPRTATPAARPLLPLVPSPPQEFVPTATFLERPPLENPPQPKPQVLVPTNSLDVRGLQQFQAVRQYWPQSHPQLLGFGGGESSAGATSSGSTFASLNGKHSPRFNASAPPFPPKAPKPSRMSTSAEDIQPVPKPSKLSASADDFQFQSIPQSHPSMTQSSWTPSSSASQCHPPLGAATASSARHDNASLNPYASVIPTAGHAYQDEPQRWGRVPPAIDRLPWLDEVQRKPADLMLAGAAEHVVHRLAEGGDEERLSVLDAVKRKVHWIMGCRERHVVFLALLRACEGRFYELLDIVMAACTGDGSLMRVATEVQGVKALKELIRVVAPYPQLSQVLITCLLREQVMEHEKGAQLLCHCFTTLPSSDCSIIVRFAISPSHTMVWSMAASKCLTECFEHARDEDLRDLELFILNNTYALAKGAYSNYFLQRVLESGTKHLQEGITERVAHSIIDLSDRPSGSYVVEACIALTCSLMPLLRLLTAFQDLHDDQLAQLVQGCHSNYVVQKLLLAGKTLLPEQTLALARRIVKLPLTVPRGAQAGKVMRIANKLIPKRMYY